MIEQLLKGTMVETQAQADARLNKVFLIVDIYKLERLLGKRKTSFYHLYELDTTDLIVYSRHLTEIQLAKMLPNRGLVRH